VIRLSSVLLGCLVAVFAIAGLAAIADSATRAQLERETHAAQLRLASAAHSG
jgi:hypothetical protein